MHSGAVLDLRRSVRKLEVDFKCGSVSLRCLISVEHSVEQACGAHPSCPNAFTPAQLLRSVSYSISAGHMWVCAAAGQ